MNLQNEHRNCSSNTVIKAILYVMYLNTEDVCLVFAYHTSKIFRNLSSGHACFEQSIYKLVYEQKILVALVNTSQGVIHLSVFSVDLSFILLTNQ